MLKTFSEYFLLLFFGKILNNFSDFKIKKEPFWGQSRKSVKKNEPGKPILPG